MVRTHQKMIQSAKENEMSTMTLIPAYGRTYESKEMVLRDWDKGKDFVMVDIGNASRGRYVNNQQQEDLKKRGVDTLKFRYGKLLTKAFTLGD